MLGVHINMVQDHYAMDGTQIKLLQDMQVEYCPLGEHSGYGYNDTSQFHYLDTVLCGIHIMLTQVLSNDKCDAKCTSLPILKSIERCTFMVHPLLKCLTE